MQKTRIPHLFIGKISKFRLFYWFWHLTNFQQLPRNFSARKNSCDVNSLHESIHEKSEYEERDPIPTVEGGMTTTSKEINLNLPIIWISQNGLTFKGKEFAAASNGKSNGTQNYKTFQSNGTNGNAGGHGHSHMQPSGNDAEYAALRDFFTILALSMHGLFEGKILLIDQALPYSHKSV